MGDQEIKRRKPEKNRKVEYIRARVTTTQKELLQRAADHAGITVSSWMVDRLLRAARLELENPVVSSLRRPVGDNLRALELVAEHGLDHEKLVALLYGGDTKKNRAKLYARIQFWKEKEWLVKSGGGSYQPSATLLPLS